MMVVEVSVAVSAVMVEVVVANCVRRSPTKYMTA